MTDKFIAGITRLTYTGAASEFQGVTGTFLSYVGDTVKVALGKDSVFWGLANVVEAIGIDCTPTPEKILSTELSTDIKFQVNYTAAKVEFDEKKFQQDITDVLAPLKDMALEEDEYAGWLAKLRKFRTSLNDRKIEIAKEIKGEAITFEDKVKRALLIVDNHISNFEAQATAVKAKKKIAKRVLIQKELDEILLAYELDLNRTAQLDIKEDYFLTKWSLSKIKEDLINRAKDLYLAQDHEAMQAKLKNTQIESRNRLLFQLNSEFDFKVTYAHAPIEGDVGGLSDEQVQELFAKKAAQRKAFEDAAKMEDLKREGPIPANWNECLNKPLQPASESFTPVPEAKEIKADIIYQTWRISPGTSGLTKMGLTKIVSELRSRGLVVEIVV